MKPTRPLILTAALLGLALPTLHAQRPCDGPGSCRPHGGPADFDGPPPDHAMRPPPPETFDRDGDGALSAAELDAATEIAAAHQLDAFLARHDLDGDNTVRLEELSETIAQHAAGRLDQLFSRLDRNGDDVIEASELGRRGVPPPLEGADLDGDGALTVVEVQAHGEGMIEAQLNQVLAEFDADGDETITYAEAAATTAARATEHIARMVENLDTDDDGTISAVELAARGPRHGDGPGQPGGHRGRAHG